MMMAERTNKAAGNLPALFLILNSVFFSTYPSYAILRNRFVNVDVGFGWDTVVTLLLSNANDDDLRFSPLFDIIIKFFYLCIYMRMIWLTV